MSERIEVGQLWEVVTDDFITSGESAYEKWPTKIPNGEVIEIRYPYAWHFRTVKNTYHHAKEDEILKHCELLGAVIRHVWANNNMNLAEILKYRVYQPVRGKRYYKVKEAKGE